MQYAILDTQHSDYDMIISCQRECFDKKNWATNFAPILNLAWTQALIQVHDILPNSDCVLQEGGDEVPSSRNMTEWIPE